MSTPVTWWARGLLFENCNCQLICPGHVHFDQLCTYDRCVGYWGIRFDAGEFDGTLLDGAKAVVAYDSPQHMIDGDWTETILIDAGCSPGQREAVEAILTGRAGGPWGKLARFVGTLLPIQYVEIRIDEEPASKRIRAASILDSTLEPIRGQDRSEPVRFDNMFNQIHSPSQVIARGKTRYQDGVIAIETEGTHGLHSCFEWSVGRS